MSKSNVAMRLSLRLLNTVGITALVAGSACVSTAAFAQTAAAGGDVEQVVVTGSRIGTPGYTTPTPVTEITPVQYQAKNIVAIADLELQIPSLTPNQATSVVNDPGASQFNLRNLGATRTLVMINGLRVGPTSVNGSVDTNLLPTNLISRVDIVTGGASAAYGSDAVAGVVALTLNTTLNGFQGKLGYGGSNYGDDGTEVASAAWGSDFAGGRGHIVIGGDYFSQLGVLQQGSRPWGRSLAAISTNSACTVITSTCSELLRVKGAVPSNISDGGNIVSAKTTTGAASTAINNITFGPGGVLQQYNLGQPLGSYNIGGSGTQQAQYMSLQPTIKRDNLFIQESYDLTDDINVWAAVRYARASEYTQAATNFNQANIAVTAQNAYIPAALQTLLTANNISTFVMSKSNFDINPAGRDFSRYSSVGRNEVRNFSGGLKGKIDAFGSTWSWDVGGQYDSNYFDNQEITVQSLYRYTLAVDSVANPAVNGVKGVPVGAPVCRSTLSNPTNNCVPINLFGPQSVTQDMSNYIMGTSAQEANISMFDVSANLRGEPFATWAGPISVATGAEYRIQRESSTVDQTSLETGETALCLAQGSQCGWRAGNNLPYAGHFSVEEGYLEIDTPLLKNSSIGTAADVDAAVRMTSYSTSGGVTTWKVGFNYSPTDEFRLRATRSHDIRAPDLQELYQTGATSFGAVLTIPGSSQTANASTQVLGNPNLKPEIGDTVTAGIIYTPEWLDGFNLSIDYWKVKLTSVLTSFSAQQEVTNCLTGAVIAQCSAITYNTAGIIQQVVTQQFNASVAETDGWDLEAGYQFSPDDVMKGIGGTVQLHVLATYLGTYITTGSANLPVDQAGSVATGGSLPHLRANLNAIWLNDPWTISLTGNWIGGGYVSQLYNPRYYLQPNAVALGAKTINNNNVAGQFLLNASVNYQISDAWTIYASGDNLLNAPPPVVADGLAISHAFANQLYDRIGGFYQIGVKLRLN